MLSPKAHSNLPQQSAGPDVESEQFRIQYVFLQRKKQPAKTQRIVPFFLFVCVVCFILCWHWHPWFCCLFLRWEIGSKNDCVFCRVTVFYFKSALWNNANVLFVHRLRGFKKIISNRSPTEIVRVPNLETTKDISVYDMFYDCYGFLFRLQSDLYLCRFNIFLLFSGIWEGPIWKPWRTII